MHRELALASLFSLTALGAQDPIGLSGLPELARQRSVRQRPKQIEALKPFIVDLELDPRFNWRVIASTVDKVVALGDGIVPVLLE